MCTPMDIRACDQEAGLGNLALLYVCCSPGYPYSLWDTVRRRPNSTMILSSLIPNGVVRTYSMPCGSCPCSLLVSVQPIAVSLGTSRCATLPWPIHGHNHPGWELENQIIIPPSGMSNTIMLMHSHYNNTNTSNEILLPEQDLRLLQQSINPMEHHNFGVDIYIDQHKLLSLSPVDEEEKQNNIIKNRGTNHKTVFPLGFFFLGAHYS